MTDALVIGAGPAGLMAAQVMAEAGLSVTIADQKPSVGRKFLMAGKSGLNLTKAEAMPAFLDGYGARDWLHPALSAFGPEQVQSWAEALGQELFTGSSGRVFPKVMKASPLLRSWLVRLDALGVQTRTRWRWLGWDGEASLFDTPEGEMRITPKVTILAMGGASWRKLGSDGAWTARLPADATAPFKPSNMGFQVDWSNHMTAHFGKPIKNIALMAGTQRVRGEAILSQKGIEGGGVYLVSAAVRDGAQLRLDLLPDLPASEIAARLAKPMGKTSFSNYLRKALKLDPLKLALLQECARPVPRDANALAALLKALPIAHIGPRPMDEAISTAGGLKASALDESLMLKDRPGVFAAGEMLDWEAPTGGYLITACLATGRWAGLAAADYTSRESTNKQR